MSDVNLDVVPVVLNEVRPPIPFRPGKALANVGSLALVPAEDPPHGPKGEVAEDINGEAGEIVGQESLDEVLNNALLVEQICSFITCPKALASIRHVNRIFQREATKHFRWVHPPINFWVNYQEVNKFLSLMNNRSKLNLTPFPFTTFGLDLCLSSWFRIMSKFSKMVGPYVHEYALKQGKNTSNHRSATQYGRFVAMLLSNSPQLEEIHVSCNVDIKLSHRDRDILPAQLPNLDIIHLTYQDSSSAEEPVNRDLDANAEHLLELLLNRVTKLYSCIIPTARDDSSYNFHPNMRCLRLIADKHRQSNPNLFLDILHLFPTKLSILREIMATELQFHELRHIMLNFRRNNGEAPSQSDINQMMQLVSTWLARQSATVKFLGLCILRSNTSNANMPVNAEVVSLHIPPLRRLESFLIDFDRYCPESQQSVRPVFQISTNDFPSLRRMGIRWYREEYGMFTEPMPRVQTLELGCYQGSHNNLFFSTIFLNLTNLRIEIESLDGVANAARNTLRCILTRVTRLLYLTILIKCCDSWIPALNFWDSLTGGAPRLTPTHRQTLFRGQIDSIESEPEQPVNGVFERPTLRNMTALKSLCVDLRNRVNLDAILYMTVTGQLVKLESLRLEGFSDFNLTDARGQAYISRLNEFHKKVETVD